MATHHKLDAGHIDLMMRKAGVLINCNNGQHPLVEDVACAVTTLGVQLIEAREDCAMYKAGLLRIAARCENWSSEDIRAAVADALGLTVVELEWQLEKED